MARAPRVYSSRKYSRNPLFRSRRRREFFAHLRNVSWRGKLLGVTVLAIIGTGVWALFFNSFFAIEQVVVKGANYVNEGQLYRITEDQLDRRRWLIFPQDNIFTFSKGQLTDAIRREVSVRNLRINKDLPGSLTVVFEEAQPEAIWFENNIFYYVDAHMRVLSPIPESRAQSSPYVTLRAGEEAEHIAWRNGVRVVDIDPTYIALAQELYQVYGGLDDSHDTDDPQSNNSDIPTPLPIDRTFLIETRETTLTMQYVGGPEVYFNIDADHIAQMNKLDALLTEKFSPNDLGNMEYIDLRFGEKVYYQ